MTRRPKVGGKPIKGRLPNAQKPRRSKMAKAAPRSMSSSPREQTEVTRLTCELSAAIERQNATAEILASVSRSSTDTRPVFDAILDNLLRLFRTRFALVLLVRNGMFEVGGIKGDLSFDELAKHYPLPVDERLLPGKAVLAGRPMQLSPIVGNVEAPSNTQRMAIEFGFNAQISVPLIRDGEAIGALSAARRDAIAFTDEQVALIKSFAAQAVIAIENARLLNELRGALERQTATSEVLQVISGSPGDLEPVFAAMLESAVRTCGAKFGNIYRVEGDGLCNVATHNTPTAFAEALRGSPYFSPGPNNPVRRMMQTKTIVHVLDVAASEAYTEREPITVASVELGQTRTLMIVPMLKDNELVGAFTLARQEVRSFTDKQIELVQNFAAQAVIAIENARLLNELRQRTDDLSQRTTDLTEALEQQTATSEVLQVISGSAGDVEPAFATMLEKAVRICDATFGNIYRWDGEALHLVATRNTPPAFAEARSRLTLRPGSTSLIGRMLATKDVVHIADVAATQAYEQRVPETVAAVEVGGVRTILGVPMLNEGELIGSFTLYRQEVRPFTDKQIALVTNFAAQAVIAIENARLLNELRQRTDDLSETLEQQTASAKVLEVISRSAFDLRAVFETVAESSVRLCEADRAFIFQYDGELLRVKAFYNASPELADWVMEHPVRPGSHLASARAALHRQTIHIPDVQVDPDYLHGGKLVDAFRTVLAVPVLKTDDLLGIILIYRLDVQPFTEKQIALVETFADQAAIAIENTRLLQELQQRTDEVINLNQELERRVIDQVDEIERMSRLRRFLPPQVADLIVASGSEKQLESHRREITALFCDLRGFTGFTESADAEDVMALLRDYHAAIGEIIIKYNGTLERYAGDGVMVVFNDPVPVENPALQAVLMALELRDALGALTATWSRLGHEIGFGIGIAHGFATLGTIGYEGRFDYAAIGTVSNVASRLCDEAKPGQILISARVLTKVENAVKVEPVGEFELKGIRRPLAAYNVLDAL